MTNYYIEKENKIVLFDTNKKRIQATLKFMPQYEGLTIQQTERPIVLSDDGIEFVFSDSEEYKAEQLQKAKESKLAENKTAYDAALKAGVVYKGELFDCDTLAAVRIMGQMVATQTAAIEEEATIDWFDYYYKPVTLTISEFMELAGLVTLNTRRIETLNCAFNTAIENAQSLEELEAVVIDYAEEADNVTPPQDDKEAEPTEETEEDDANTQT